MVEEIHSLSDVFDFVDRIIVENRLSIMELENKAGISVGMISRWKNNGYAPKFAIILKILYFLNTTITFKSELLNLEVPIYSKNDVLDFIE